MNEKLSNDDVNQIKEIWKLRSLGVDITADYNQADFKNETLSLFHDISAPFLQIANTSELDFCFREPELSRLVTSVGWTISHNEKSISATAPYDLNQAAIDRITTDTQQLVVNEMIKLSLELEWPSISLIGGSSLMKRLLWIEAKQQGLEIAGYEPPADDKLCLSRLGRLLNTKSQAQPEPHKKPEFLAQAKEAIDKQ